MLELNSTDATTVFIPYPKAYIFLYQKFETTPEEIAAWVFSRPECGGLAAYLNGNELDSPPRFIYDIGYSDDFDYLSPLMACWFLEKEITDFQPVNRFITGEKLIRRWSEIAGIQANAFIKAKIDESRLMDIHPTYGTTQASYDNDESYPPLESRLFLMSEVKQIEKEDLATIKADKDNLNKRLQRDANKLASQWKNEGLKKFTKRDIADNLASSSEWKEMTSIRIERIICKMW